MTDEIKMTTPDSSPMTHKSNAKSTPRTNNTQTARYQRKKTTHLHLSTIPPPSCPLDLFVVSHNDDDVPNISPTSIVDIFADLNSLASQLDKQSNRRSQVESVATSSVASTTLGSMDTPTFCGTETNYADPYYEDDDDDVYVHAGKASREEEKYEDEYHPIRGVPVDYATLQEEFQYLLVDNENESTGSAKEECKDNDWYDSDKRQREHGHTAKMVDDSLLLQNEYNNQKKKHAVVIENGGTKVYKWHSSCFSPKQNKNTPPLVISNGNKAVFHYEVVMSQDKYSCMACPTASGF